MNFHIILWCESPSFRFDLAGDLGGLATVQEQEKEMQSMQWLLLFEENAISEISKMNSGQFPGTNAIFESSQRYSSDTSGIWL